MDRLDEKLDLLMEHILDIKVDMSSMKADISANKDSLVEHVRRTNLLESQLKEQDKLLTTAMKPIEWARTTGKIIAWLIPIIGGIVGAWLAWTQGTYGK